MIIGDIDELLWIGGCVHGRNSDGNSAGLVLMKYLQIQQKMMKF